MRLFLAFLVGCVAGILFSFIPFIEFDGSVGAGDILTLLYTIVLTVLVSLVWRDAQFNSDSLKQAGSVILDEIRKEVDSIHRESISFKESQDYNVVLKKLAGSFRILFNGIHELDEMLKAQGKSIVTEKIRKEAQKAKRLLTGGSPSEGFNHAVIDQGIIKMTHIRREVSLARVRLFK